MLALDLSEGRPPEPCAAVLAALPDALFAVGTELSVEAIDGLSCESGQGLRRGTSHGQQPLRTRHESHNTHRLHKQDKGGNEGDEQQRGTQQPHEASMRMEKEEKKRSGNREGKAEDPFGREKKREKEKEVRTIDDGKWNRLFGERTSHGCNTVLSHNYSLPSTGFRHTFYLETIVRITII